MTKRKPAPIARPNDNESTRPAPAFTGRAVERCPVCLGMGFLAAVGALGVVPVPCVECAGGIVGCPPASVDDAWYEQLERAEARKRRRRELRAERKAAAFYLALERAVADAMLDAMELHDRAEYLRRRAAS